MLYIIEFVVDLFTTNHKGPDTTYKTNFNI